MSAALFRFSSVVYVALLLVSSALANSGGGGEARYAARGIVKALDVEHKRATIAHDAIAGYMPAMVMSFEVRDLRELRSLHPGERVNFLLHVKGNDAWIDQLANLGQPDAPLFEQAAPDSSQEKKPGDSLPEVELTGDHGEPVCLSALLGNAVALTFIYTRCPLPTYCPRINRNFETANTLLERLGSLEKCRFISVSMDPEHDTPEVLRDYAKAYRASRDHWIFATGSEAAVRMLGRAVGLQFQHTGERVDHNLRTVVVDASGKIRRIFRGNDWTPQELAAEMRAASKG